MRSAVTLSLICASLLGLFACSSAQQVQPVGTIAEPLRSGYPADTRLLVIEAEDLGMGHSIDKASFEAIENHWVTAAGVLVPAPWFPEVVRWSRKHPIGDLGVQLDLNSEWVSFRWKSTSVQSTSSGLNDPAGYLPNGARYIIEHSKPEEVANEFNSQLAYARNAGLIVSHVDSHGGVVLLTPWLFREYLKASVESSLPLVLSKEYVLQHGKPTPKKNVFDLGGVEIDVSTIPIDRIFTMEPGFAQKEWLDAYEKTLGALPPGVYLLSVHLGYNDEELQAMTVDHPNWGAQWRQNDLDVVSNPVFQKFLKDKGFILVGWKDLQKVTPVQRPKPN